MLKKANKNKYPSVYIIGAQKAATTSLYEWLKQDRRLLFPKYKETHYFSYNYKYGEKWYFSQFRNRSHELKCEIDPSYIYYKNALKRIHQINVNAKFIVILRKPIDRSYSHFLMSKYRGYEDREFNVALELEKKRLNCNDSFSENNFSYLRRSEYSSQLNYLFKKFNKNQCMLIKFDSLFNNKELTINNIYKFLKINNKYNLNLNNSFNNASFYKNKILRDLLYKKNYIRSFFQIVIPSRYIKFKIKEYLNTLNLEKIDSSNKKNNYDTIIKKLPDKYKLWNNTEVNKLMKISNIDIDDWIIK